MGKGDRNKAMASDGFSLIPLQVRMMRTLGIDVSKKRFHVALLRENGKFVTKAFDNTPAGFQALERWLHAKGATHPNVCLESTGTYSEALATHLFEAGYTVSMENPARIKHFARSAGLRTKNDAVDARAIARYAEAMQPEPWAPAPREVRELKALVRRLEAQLAMRTQEQGRLEADPPPIVREEVETHIAYLDSAIEATRKRIRDHIDNHPGLKQDHELLKTIPGLGDTTAAHLLAELDVRRYPSARQAAAYLGLTPRQHQSGTSVHGPARLAKEGNGRLRKALYFPALAAMRANPVIVAFAKRLRDRGKRPMVVVAAAMRKLIHIAFGVLKSQRPFNPQAA